MTDPIHEDNSPATGETESLPAATTDPAQMTGRQKAWLAVLVLLKRVRFLAILLAVGMFIGYWEAIKNHWDKWTRPRAAVSRKLEAGQEFFCPMHPNVVRESYEPNGDVPKCPICGMPLSVRKKGEKEALPPGITGRVQLTPERIQLAGIETVPVEYRPIARETTTVGYVAYDESRRSQVVSRAPGYVEKLYVDKTFAEVREGAELVEIYSPELFSTAKELVLASRPGVSPDLGRAARERLKLFGVAEKEIDAIARSGEVNPRLLLRSPRSGYVIEKKVVVGSSVEAGMTLLEIADLSTVWIEAEVYEKDIAFVRPGQEVRATVEALPNEAFKGKVALVYPQVEAATRTNRVRFEVDNGKKLLRPGMFATVRIGSPLETASPQGVLAVPERAVVDTGAKKIVYVERQPGLFDGVEVQLGPRAEIEVGGRQIDFYPVLAGLQQGDRVAAAGAFLIDAETRLNPAASSYFGASGGPQEVTRSEGPRSATPAAKPDMVTPKQLKAPSQEDLEAVAELPEEDRPLAQAQRWCPVRDEPLGSMGTPVKITLRGKPVFLCCKGCLAKAKREPDAILQKVEQFKAQAQ